jgi:ribosomal protein S18 acetylase RimI-like enzyme
MNITVRQARREDAGAITDFNLAMAAETEDKGLDADKLRAGVLTVFDHPDRAVYRVAEMNGEVVGSLMVTTEWSDWRNGTFWWIQSVYVRPEFRRQGVYRAMHEEVCSAAKAAEGVCGVRLYVERENTSAQQVYEAMGMSATSYRLFEVEFG